MTGERFIVKGNWIEDKCIGKLLNIDFNTITDAVLCCDLLNQIEKEKRNNGKIANKYLEENELLKKSVNNLKDTIVTIGIAYQKKHDGTLVDLIN